MRDRSERQSDSAAGSARRYLESEVDKRANHTSAEDVRTTCSFARAERLLGREYHGRFLIELLQNAADASRGVESRFERSRLVVQVVDGPALLVANEGATMGAEVVIQSLGRIGASTKAEGEADKYAVLVVLRAKGGGVPTAMHLLSDPVKLEETGRLRMEADGYQIAYQTGGP